MNNEKVNELIAQLQSIAEEDARDPEIVGDGTGDILLGRAELAESLLSWIEENLKEVSDDMTPHIETDEEYAKRVASINMEGIEEGSDD